MIKTVSYGHWDWFKFLRILYIERGRGSHTIISIHTTTYIHILQIYTPLLAQVIENVKLLLYSWSNFIIEQL